MGRSAVMLCVAAALALVRTSVAPSPATARTLRYTPASGSIIWWSLADDPSHGQQYVAQVGQQPGGGLVLAGSSESEDPSVPDIFLCMYDGNDAASPHLLRRRSWDGPAHLGDTASGMAIDGSGNVIVAGSTQVVGGTYDWVVVKWDAGGTPLWQGSVASRTATGTSSCPGTPRPES
jgi:hypothetical protein